MSEPASTRLLIYSLHFKHALSLQKNFFRRFICKAQIQELCD